MDEMDGGFSRLMTALLLARIQRRARETLRLDDAILVPTDRRTKRRRARAEGAA